MVTTYSSVRLDWQGGRPWGKKTKNQWRWCYTLEGDAFIEVQLQDGEKGDYLIWDPQDLPLVEATSWRAHKDNRNTYAVGGDPYAKRQVKFHRQLVEWKKIDHIDHNGLNNRRSNLRDGTEGENERNQRRAVNNTSGYKGVGYDRSNFAYRARIINPNTNLREQKLFPGIFDSEAKEAAVQWYAEKAKEFGYYVDDPPSGGLSRSCFFKARLPN